MQSEIAEGVLRRVVAECRNTLRYSGLRAVRSGERDWTHDMALRIEPRHDLSPDEIDAIEDRIYRHNADATGHRDARGLGFVIRSEAGHVIGVVAGFTWSGTCELKQMWVDEAYRGRGYARALLDAFMAEARNRGVLRIWVASYDFQAPGLYEKAGFTRVAEFPGWPEGHTNVVLCKSYTIGKADHHL